MPAWVINTAQKSKRIHNFTLTVSSQEKQNKNDKFWNAFDRIDCRNFDRKSSNVYLSIFVREFFYPPGPRIIELGFDILATLRPNVSPRGRANDKILALKLNETENRVMRLLRYA